VLVVEHRAIASVSIYRQVKPRVLSKIAATHSLLADKRDELRANGVNVTDMVDHQWSKSIYFKDPHCLSLEYRCAARSRTEEEAMPEPFTASHARTGSDACFDQSQQHTHWSDGEARQSSTSSRWSARLVPSRVDCNQCSQLRNSTQHFRLKPPLDSSLS
jgi:hypothetical protein